MVRVILFTIFAISISSCDILKKSQKTKADITEIEETEVKTVRIGDTVRYFLPSIKYKDTTIYTFNRQGTTLKTVYDKSGQVSEIECQTSAIELYERIRKSMTDQTVTKEKEKSETLNTDWILYGFIMIGAVLIVALILMYSYMRKNTALVNSIASKL